MTLSFILPAQIGAYWDEITSQVNACAGRTWYKPAAAKNKTSTRTTPVFPSLLSDALLGPATTQPLPYFLAGNRASQKILSGTSQWPQMRKESRMLICTCFYHTFRATKQKLVVDIPLRFLSQISGNREHIKVYFLVLRKRAQNWLRSALENGNVISK